MRILIIGSGGREHALAWAVARSTTNPHLFIAPGNAGTALIGENIPIQATDIEALLQFAHDEQIDLTIVGPEQPLVMGMVDAFEEAGLRIVGPSAAAARLEGSKAFSKAFMQQYDIPTAAYRTFSAEAYNDAKAYLQEQGVPIVIKASGLAAGKGAIVCETLAAAVEALDHIMLDRAFGAAGDEVVIEAFMRGEEASVFALTDGTHYRLLATAQDHKRIGEGDTGPNTGGMGAYAPAPVMDEALLSRVCNEIIEPTLAGMRAEGCLYKGILYVGLMMTAEGPKVVEYNCRLGDPETQVVLPLVASDLAAVFMKLAEGRLDDAPLDQHAGAAACVVMASAGYPGSYEKGFAITGLEEAASLEEVLIFQAGTRRDAEGHLVTDGGRVLAVAARGADLATALERAYAATEHIHFEGAQYRRDIGQKGLARLQR
jgi:phosphoribosylamine--glycine ligase